MALASVKRVLIADKVNERCQGILQEAGLDVVIQTGLAEDALTEAVAKVDALIVRSASKVTEKVFAGSGGRLKLIGRAGTGVDNIDVAAANRYGAVVMNTPAGNTLSAAEHTCALISAVARHVAQGAASLAQGRWERASFMGSELFGKTLGVIGLGRIGREVANRMRAFGMMTVGYDPIITAEQAAEFKVTWYDLEKLWDKCDYITVHVPLIPQTTSLINRDVLSRCRPGVKLINVARGGIINEKDLLDALEDGTCGGAGLDVFTSEPPACEVTKALCAHPKVVATPHLGASTREAQVRVACEIAEQFVDAIKGRSLFGAINASSLALALSPLSTPYISLCDNLGQFLSAFWPSTDRKVAIMSIKGHEQLSKLRPALSSSFLRGLIVAEVGQVVNLVNVDMMAKEKGYSVTSDFQEQDDEIITVTAGSHKVAGAPISKGLALVSIDAHEFNPPALIKTGNVVVVLSTKDAKKFIDNVTKDGSPCSVTCSKPPGWCVAVSNNQAWLSDGAALFPGATVLRIL